MVTEATDCPELLPVRHLEWAAGIAHTIANHRGLRQQERDDLISTAQLALLEILARSCADGGFCSSRVPTGGDIAGAFRGWAYLTIRCTVTREVERMFSGGMIRKAIRPGNRLTVLRLNDSANCVRLRTTDPDRDDAA